MTSRLIRPGPPDHPTKLNKRPKWRVGHLEIPGVSSTTRFLVSSIRDATHGKHAVWTVGHECDVISQNKHTTPQPCSPPHHVEVDHKAEVKIMYCVLLVDSSLLLARNRIGGSSEIEFDLKGFDKISSHCCI